MSYVNFKLPNGKTYSVDFKVYSDEHRIADSGYKMLDPTEEPVATAANTFKDAESWREANKAIFEDEANKPQPEST